ncbi:uncharacterized protein SCHCODRAFT_01041862, partial [Schizophyllum commune H4-8]|uniref:uncharacterized protein n=1 Tax=Schizophyllum commune (strain H4-8 / FGSC 9210) TaxID=578458 RepID=UPI0021602EE6
VEPQPDEPGVLFIRAPWTDFPGADSHPDGLTYSILAEHPEWFLDARDFLSETNDDPKAIAYPVVLEPPRGWCPAKKKDVKAKSQNGGNPDEPKLRCTFCRRTYLGVNAKSMWRRHVYEKHKIAMANRRD